MPKTASVITAILDRGATENTKDLALLPVLPNGALPAAIAIKSATTSTAQNIAINSGTAMVVISAKDNNAFYRFKTASDTADVTAADGGNARGEVLSGSQRVEVPVSGATYISVIGGDGTARVTLEQRA